MHGGAADASSWIAGHQTRPDRADNRSRGQGTVSARSRATPVSCRPPQPAVGFGLYLRFDLVELAVRGFCD